MLEWTAAWTEKLGGKVQLYENPCKTQQLDDGTTIPLPPIMLGSFGNDPKKKTVCVYGHLDVQPALLTDGWNTEPFELTEIDGKLFGRGSTDDKGPALSWLWMVEAFNELKMDLPVNIKMIYEGMEEYGSEGMFETVNEVRGPPPKHPPHLLSLIIVRSGRVEHVRLLHHHLSALHLDADGVGGNGI